MEVLYSRQGEGEMSRAQRISIIIFFIVLLPCLVAARNQRLQQELTRRQPYGRYTEQQFIDSCLPLIAVFLPNTHDINLITDKCNIGTPDGGTRLEWHLRVVDTKGYQLIKIVRDASTGRVNLVSYGDDIISSLLSASWHPHRLTEQQAIVCAKNWMRRLEYNNDWFPMNTHKHIGSTWNIILHSQTWKATIILSERTGTMNFAMISSLAD
jgi:hypothetical protein